LIIRDLAVVGTAGGEFGEIGRSGAGLDGEQVRAILTSVAYDPPRVISATHTGAEWLHEVVERALHGRKRSEFARSCDPEKNSKVRQRDKTTLSLAFEYGIENESIDARSGIDPLSETKIREEKMKQHVAGMFAACTAACMHGAVTHA
jgi:hypothetical protein